MAQHPVDSARSEGGDSLLSGLLPGVVAGDSSAASLGARSAATTTASRIQRPQVDTNFFSSSSR